MSLKMTTLNNVPSPRPSSITRKVAWLNIFIQLAFPIVTTMPTQTFANENNFKKHNISDINQQNTYQVKAGDTPESIAKKFNIKLFKLIEANPQHVSLTGELKINDGTILNIPNEYLLKKKWLNNQDEAIPSTEGEELAKIIVDNSFLLNKDIDVTQYAISQISSKSNQKIEQWLNQFGHARVSLSADKNLTLKNSSAELLIPLYEQKEKLIFAQTNYHRKDLRSQFNYGIGYRYFTEKFMVGINGFYDHDLTHHHNRLGIGAEIWRDYFKLSSNHYHRLSSWRASNNILDYSERPANGWDIRTEGYFPAYPQLGTKLIFKQYYGKEVGLFGKDKRDKNPHTYTLGINYTPIPLVTLNAERRIGLHDRADNNLNINLSYRIGESLASQLNPDNVKAIRTLAGSRYDFVNRNNDMILEYKKETLVFLSMVDSINGYAKEERDLQVQVKTKYPLANIEWSASKLNAQGGQIKHHGGTHYTVILPQYQIGGIEKNSYIISAVAIDTHGNRSAPVQTTVIVDKSLINTRNSLFSPKQSQLFANGEATQRLILSIVDNDNLPVDIDSKEITLQQQSDTEKGNSRISTFSRLAAGKYQLTVTAGSIPEKLTLTPVFRDNTFNSATVTLIADNQTAHIAKGNLTVTKDNAPADGKSQNKIKVRVTDSNHNPLAHYPVNFTASNGANVISSRKTDEQGEIIASVTNTHVGSSQIGVQVKGITYSTEVHFSVDNDSAYIPQQNFTITPPLSLADGKTEKTISLQVVDKQNNPIPATHVTLSADNQAQLKQTILTTDEQGKATTTMISKVAGTVTVRAKINDKMTHATTQFIANQAKGVIVSITPSSTTHVADGQTPVILTALVQDQFGKPLPHAQISWETEHDKSIVNIEHTTMTNEQGITTNKLTSTQALSVRVTARINNNAFTAEPITFIANGQQALISELLVNKNQIVADKQDPAELTAIVTDKLGNQLPDTIVNWQGSAGTQFAQQQTKTDAQGIAKNTLTTSQSGITTITARLNNGQHAQTNLVAVADLKSATLTLTTLNNKQSAIADNQDSITVVANLTDAYHNPLKNTPVYWQSSINHIDETTTQTDEKGRTQVVISGTKAQPTTITAYLSNKEKKSIQVTFVAGAPVQQNSYLTIEPQSIIADGNAFAVGKIDLRDKFDNPVIGRNNDIALIGDNSTIQFSKITETANGNYQAHIRGTKAGLSQITATIDSITVTQSLGFLTDNKTVKIHSVKVMAPYTVTANGKDKVIIQAQITDKHNNPVSKGVTVGWISDLGELAAPLSMTNKQGIAEITLSSTQAGKAKVTAVLNNQQSVNADHIVTFTEGDISASLSTVAIFPDTIVAGANKATVTITLKDKEGNLLPNLANKITLTPQANLQTTITPFKEKQKGIYQAQVSALKTGKTSLSAHVAPLAIKQSVSLTVLPNNTTAKVKNFTISNMQPHAGESITYKAYLVDNHDNPVGMGVPVAWSTNEGSQLETPLTFTDDNGVAIVGLSRRSVGVAKVSAILETGTYIADDVHFLTGHIDETMSELSLNPSQIIANGKDKALLTFVIKDKNGNIIPNQQVSGFSKNPTIKFSQAQQISPGRYEIEITGTQSGTAQIGVMVNGTHFKKQKILQLNADVTTWKIRAVEVDRTTITAGDKGVNYQATVVDANNNVLPNVIVSWKLLGSADDYHYSTYTNDKGIATNRVTSHVAGRLKMSAYLDSNNYKSTQDITVIPAEIDIHKSTFNSHRRSINADNKDSTLLSVKLMDKYDNTIDGKNVEIKTISGKPNFSDNPLKSVGNGEYQTNVTANTMSDIILTAQAETITIAEPLTIKVAIPKSEITFEKPIQQEIYKSTVIDALSYKGVPQNMQVIWSSSDPTVASIDTTSGQISMKKAGTTIITLQTLGNEQYPSAKNSYPLVIEKAPPKLKVTSPHTIQSIWNDGITHQITAEFDNPEVKNTPIHFSSSDTLVATIDSKGNLTAIKPGKTKIVIQSDATDKFLADSQTVDYQQGKAALSYYFKKNYIVLTPDSAADKLLMAQSPTPDVPVEANATWYSSQPNIVEITPDGIIKNLNIGQTTLTLEVKNNNYFQDHEQSYNVIIQASPRIKINSFEFLSAGESKSNTHLDDLTWQPLYTSDDQFIVKWSSSDTPKAINFELFDENGTSIALEERQNYAPKYNIHDPVKIQVPKQYLTSPKQLTLEVTTFDSNNQPYVDPKKYKINIDYFPANNAYKIISLDYNSKFIYTDTGALASSCQNGWSTTTTHLILTPRLVFKGEPKKLLYPIYITTELYDVTLNPSDKLIGHINEKLTYPDKIIFSEHSKKIAEISPTSAHYALDEECRINDSGHGTLKANITIGNRSSYLKKEFHWDGQIGGYF